MSSYAPWTGPRLMRLHEMLSGRQDPGATWQACFERPEPEEQDTDPHYVREQARADQGDYERKDGA